MAGLLQLARRSELDRDPARGSFRNLRGCGTRKDPALLQPKPFQDFGPVAQERLCPFSGANRFVVFVPPDLLDEEQGPSIRIWCADQISIDGEAIDHSVEAVPLPIPVGSPMSECFEPEIGIGFSNKRMDQPKETWISESSHVSHWSGLSTFSNVTAGTLSAGEDPPRSPTGAGARWASQSPDCWRFSLSRCWVLARWPRTIARAAKTRLSGGLHSPPTATFRTVGVISLAAINGRLHSQLLR
jgi:hypothetical protein